MIGMSFANKVHDVCINLGKAFVYNRKKWNEWIIMTHRRLRNERGMNVISNITSHVGLDNLKFRAT